MEPLKGLTPAGTLLSTLWDSYKEDSKSQNSQKLMAFIKVHMPAFTPSDQNLFDQIKVTLTDTKALPDFLKVISDLSQTLKNSSQDLNPLDVMPKEQKKADLLYWEYSIADLLNLSRVNREMKELVRSRLVEIIEAARKEMTPNELLRSLVLCGPDLRHLMLQRRLRWKISLNVFKKALEKCPNLHTLVLSESNLFGAHKYSEMLDTILINHFKKFPESITDIFIVTEDYDKTYNLRRKKELPPDFSSMCPNLRQFNLSEINFALSVWLDKGKDINTYFTLLNQIKSLPELQSINQKQRQQLYLVDPDWFLALSQDSRIDLLKAANELDSLFLTDIDFEVLAALPKETLNLLLEIDVNDPQKWWFNKAFKSVFDRIALINELDPKMLAQIVMRFKHNRTYFAEDDPFLKALMLCGASVEYLDMMRLFPLPSNANTIEEVVDRCPNLKKFVINIDDSQEEVERILDYIIHSQMRHTLTHFALVVRCSQPIPPLDENLIECKMREVCPNLKHIYIFNTRLRGVYECSRYSEDDFFDFCVHLEQAREIIRTSPNLKDLPFTDLLNKAPEWLVKLSPEKREKIPGNKGMLQILENHFYRFLKLSEEDQMLFVDQDLIPFIYYDECREDIGFERAIMRFRDSKLTFE